MVWIFDEVTVLHLLSSDVVGDCKTTVLSEFAGCCFVGKECNFFGVSVGEECWLIIE